jgi:hypothetical protein
LGRGGVSASVTARLPFADYAAALKQRGGLRWPAAVRRLAQMRRDYPAAQLAAAILGSRTGTRP